MDSGGSFGKLLHQPSLYLRGLGNYIVVRYLRDGKMELICRLNVCNFLEQIHQLRQIEEPAESCPGTVALALGCQFQSGDGFTKSGRPAVEVGHVHFFQMGILQIPLHGVEFRHTVADRRTCGKDHAPIPGEFIHVAALAEHIAGFLRIRCGKTGDIAHLCI